MRVLIIAFLALAVVAIAEDTVEDVDKSSDEDIDETQPEVQPLSDADREALEKCKTNKCNNPWQHSGQFQGDILVSNVTINGRYGVTYNYWPTTTIPYVYGTGITRAHKTVMLNAINIIQADTCVTFQNVQNPTGGYLYITAHEDGCFADLGYARSQRRVNIGPGCNDVATALHELLHGLGFEHEHSGYDRNKFITVNLNNVEEEYKYAFDIAYNTDNYGVPYDYYSVMHYDRTAFSKNGRDTIIPIKPGVADIIGRGDSMSPSDFKRVNRRFKCPKGYRYD